MQPPDYDPNIPASQTDSLASTQSQLQNNFFQIYNDFLRNHVSLNAVLGAGNHTIVQLIQNENDFQTGVDELSIYTKNAADQTDQIFFRYQGNGKVIQFTNYQIYSIDATTFFTFLPGRVIVYFGSFVSLHNNILNLVPAVSKHIITVSFTPIGNNIISSYKPKIALQQPSGSEKFYKAITVLHGNSLLGAAPPCFYVILGNV